MPIQESRVNHMRKNRIIATIWISVIVLIVIVIIGYIIYASIYNPYFKTNTSMNTINVLNAMMIVRNGGVA